MAQAYRIAQCHTVSMVTVPACAHPCEENIREAVRQLLSTGPRCCEGPDFTPLEGGLEASMDVIVLEGNSNWL